MVTLEHTLIMLLLLISLLKARPRLPAWLRWAAAAVVLFALVAPTARIPLPRGRRAYPALFKTPVSPEQMPAVYAGMLAARTAADLMTAPVIAVPETASLNRAILLMYQHDLKVLPVVRETPQGGQVPVGVVTRAGIISHLAEGTR